MKILSGITVSLLFLLCGGIGYYVGTLFTSFDINSCYSAIIGQISDAVKVAEKSENDTEINELIRKLDMLPPHGYESSCEEIERSVNGL